MSLVLRSSLFRIAVLVACGLVGEPSALASNTFPAEVRRVTGAPCDPPCTICHQNLQGGFNTVVHEFGVQLKDQQFDNLVPYTPSSFEPALVRSEADGTDDADEDGVSNREELMRGIDPNRGDRPFCGAASVVDPVYGCGARIAPPPRVDGVALACAAMMAVALARLGRRK